jgi:hypothetical protein
MSRISAFWWGIIGCFAITFIFLFDFILKINQLEGPFHIDVFFNSFVIKHYLDVLLTGNWSNIATLPMFYGFSNSLFYSDMVLPQAILALPNYFLTGMNMITTYNLVVLELVLASTISMYLLCFYFTKSALGSLVGATIFVFNPFLFAHFPDHLALICLVFIPLIFLYTEKILVAPTGKNVFILCLLLTLQLTASVYYFAFLSVSLPIYFIVRARQSGKNFKFFINFRTILIGIFFIGIILALTLAYKNALSSGVGKRDVSRVDRYFSIWPSDLLFTPDTNLLYGGIRNSFVKAFPLLVNDTNSAEKNLFWGVVPIILFIISFKYVRKSQSGKIWKLCLFLLALNFSFIFGPYIHLSKTFEIPGPYLLLYNLDPVFGFIRAVSRFGVLVFFFLGLISALTVWKFSTINFLFRRKFLVILLLVLLIMEYWNKPLDYQALDNPTRDFYQFLNNQPQIKVIVELPIGNSISQDNLVYGRFARSDLNDSRYLVPATIYHKKLLLNGYSGYMPLGYSHMAQILSLDFPNKESLIALKRWGVDAIILNRTEFKTILDYNNIGRALISLKIPVLVSTDDLVLFDLTKVSP